MPDWGIAIEGGWYDDAKHLYRDEKGTVVPSTTQVFDVLGCSDFSMIDPEIINWKRVFGSAYHKAVELLVFDQLDWDTCDEAIIAPTVGTEQWLRAVEYQPIAAEEKRIATFNGMKCGQTSDHRGTLMCRGVRRPAIVDLKSGSKFSPTWNWQLGSYVGGAPKPDNGSYVGVVLQADKVGRITPHWVDVERAKREFVVMLAACNLKLNNGMAKIREGTPA